MPPQLHTVQASILYCLRHAEELRFSEMMRPSGLTSDVFKFHLRNLIKLQFVTKANNGLYHLTPIGKEFANNLDRKTQQPLRQPKLSVIVLVTNDVGQVLCHQRNRNPYMHFWGLISGPVKWGEEIEEAARRELRKQAGLEAACTITAFIRQRDYLGSTNQLLEDKLFAVVRMTTPKGRLLNTWHGGINRWMDAEELKQQPHVFTASLRAVELGAAPPPYTTIDTTYTANDY